MNNLQIFKNNEFGEIRTTDNKGDVWFVAKDIAEVLGYKNSTRDVNRHVDDEDKGGTVLVTPGGKQEVLTINESGLYSLILRSNLPTARKFKRWVTSEVLPTIRRKGLYATDELLNNPDVLIKVLEELKKERFENKVKSQQIAELKPKADYLDNILNNSSLVTVTQIAKDYGMSGQRFNKLLNELKVQYKLSNQWLLYQNYADKGYTHSETVDITKSTGEKIVKMNTKWTQKGRLFLYDLLKKNGHLPKIEK